MGDDLEDRYAETLTWNISKFYVNTKIFITGATGFVGKALIEKLLRSCEKIDSIFILMRSKHGMSAEQRLKELFKNPVFNRLRDKNPDAFEKVKIIPGDVSLPNLGICEDDWNYLIDNIDIVFHSAATVKFNEDLRTALTLNTLGTKMLLELCRKMKKLKSCIYVSTAYSNSDKRVVNEKVYETKYNVDTLISYGQTLPNDVLQTLRFAKDIFNGKHPNTYTFTKALAEQLVLENFEHLPIAIVRPSIITAAWKEPYPGWVDNLSGITGIITECSRGTVKSIICDEQCRMDLIPVDIVVNTLITSAWHVVAYKSKNKRVYNCTSGYLNPITWKKFGEITHKQCLNWPSKYVTWYPGFRYTTNRTLHSIYALLYHNLPSFFLDLGLYCSGKKPMLLKLSKKLNQALEAGSFFSTNEWSFGSESYVSLIQAVKAVNDKEQFQVDIRLGCGFDWEEYVEIFLKGVREFILKDDLKTLPMAKIKLNRLYWIHKFVQAVPWIILLQLVWRSYIN